MTGVKVIISIAAVDLRSQAATAITAGDPAPGEEILRTLEIRHRYAERKRAERELLRSERRSRTWREIVLTYIGIALLVWIVFAR